MRTIRTALASLGPSRTGLLILGATAGAVAVTAYAIADRVTVQDARSAPVADVRKTHARDAPPTATEFAGLLVDLSNAYAKKHGSSIRLANAQCVQASPGHYMCSYTVRRPGRHSQCHLAQVEWTPGQASSFRVTVSGRVARCRTLRQAIRSLR
jgi:hypothetical protein